MAKAGHNLNPSHLASFIDRIEALESDKSQIAEDIKDIYLEVKSAGYDVKIVRAVIKMRAEDKEKRDERQAMIDLYMNALGDLADTPLGRAAIEKI